MQQTEGRIHFHKGKQSDRTLPPKNQKGHSAFQKGYLSFQMGCLRIQKGHSSFQKGCSNFQKDKLRKRTDRQ